MSDVHNRHYLAGLFEPRSVAIVGATRVVGKVGAVLAANMQAAGFRGPLYAVNPKYASVGGMRCFPSLSALPKAVDLAVVATPASTVPGIIAQCGRAGIRAAVVITAGFGETGAEGKRLEREVLDCARHHGVRMVGPNCLGILRPAIGLNATFARGGALPGSLGLVSQSGAVCTAMLDWAAVNNVGFSSIVSLGGSVDIDFGEIVDYLAADSATEHLLLYVEGVRDARRFAGSLRAAARSKPVILMKVGRHPAGTRAAVSHTGAIVGSDDVFDAVVRRTGAVRVASIDEMVAAAQALSAHVRPRGNRLAVITNGGGPGVMAADRSADLGLPLAELAAGTLAQLGGALPANWSQGNPVDLIGDADSHRYRVAVSACLADEGVDGVLVILTPQAMTDAAGAARAVIEARGGSAKPIIACWMGEQSVGEGRALLRQAGIPVFRTPDPAVEMFAHVSAFYRNQRALLQVPGPLAHSLAPDLAAAGQIMAAARAGGRSLLRAAESRALLKAFHIPVVEGELAGTPAAAGALAARMGFPVALKIVAYEITHKSEVGGVRLDLQDPGAVVQAGEEMLAMARSLRPEARIEGLSVEPMVRRLQGRELMIGLLRDQVFGPAISFGLGGTAVEVLRDRSIALPPLNAALAAEMIDGTRAAILLGTFRGMAAADRDAVVSVLLRVSEMACELPGLVELDINPLLADAQGVLALDARVVLGDAAPVSVKAAGRYAHLAIPPYPAELAGSLVLADGSAVMVRPIRPEDAALEQAFVAGLSEDTRRFRFMAPVRELSPDMLARFTQIDYDREMALIAIDESRGGEVEVAVARYVTCPDGESCEFAIVVADAWQGRGLGRLLMRRLAETARGKGLKRMLGYVLADNACMLALCRRLGCQISTDEQDPHLRVAMLTVQ
jgi:acetyltransferase